MRFFLAMAATMRAEEAEWWDWLQLAGNAAACGFMFLIYWTWRATAAAFVLCFAWALALVAWRVVA
jgi:hypothetical protein